MARRPDIPVRRAYAQVGPGQLHYRICIPQEPTRRPLMLFHPTPKSGWIYETIMPLLAAQGRTVIAPDTPGYGASDPPHERPSIEGYAEAMLALADALVAGECLDVAGYHTGSSTAVQMAVAQPERIGKIALFSIAAYDAEARAAKLRSLAPFKTVCEDGSHLSRMWNTVAQLSDARADPEWRQRSVTENLRAADGPAGYRAVYNHDLKAAARKVRQPVLLINAQDDLWELTRLNRDCFPHCIYRELPGTAHGMFTFAAPEIARLLQDFLDVD
ncbi:alpha/beta fold hydrolase [Novosphingobium sp. PY1]|uniref:alpha/beta fold hydrolase n=1 Tax=Novosphingobium sp. PY1 TaxID=1882221 RepID=UPI001A8E29E3|nr:alpha/beta hydrolase [Novosphingobium sp. PY1]GFM29839.1 alpha/beta hydrolase [Novosphingobium sp. PY1]